MLALSMNANAATCCVKEEKKSYSITKKKKLYFYNPEHFMATELQSMINMINKVNETIAISIVNKYFMHRILYIFLLLELHF